MQVPQTQTRDMHPAAVAAVQRESLPLDVADTLTQAMLWAMTEDDAFMARRLEEEWQARAAREQLVDDLARLAGIDRLRAVSLVDSTLSAYLEDEAL